jgi:hypothetical protein
MQPQVAVVRRQQGEKKSQCRNCDHEKSVEQTHRDADDVRGLSKTVRNEWNKIVG